MKSATLAADVIPRRALLAGGVLLVVLVGAVGTTRLAGFRPAATDAATVAERSLRFADRSDGGIDVIDAANDRRIAVMQGEQGFLRGTLRGLVRERKRLNLSTEAPLTLLARADGRLTLLDPSTGQRIDLESFGRDNLALFARWLPAPAKT